MLYTRNWVLYLLEEAKKNTTFFDQLNHGVVRHVSIKLSNIGKNQCFNMFQHVFPMFQSYSQISGKSPEFFRVFPQILYSGLFVRFAWAVQPRNYILASCRETQRFSLEEFHGATSNSWFFVWGKMMMNPKKMGVSIHK